MLVDRYLPMDLFALAPDLPIGFDPVLRQLDRLLEDTAIHQEMGAWQTVGVGIWSRVSAMDRLALQ